MRLHHPDILYGATRERLLFEEWCFINICELLAKMGLPDGWWCALNLPRFEVFGEASGGDIDLLAGPLRLTISDAEFAAWVEEERRTHQGVQEGMALQRAHMRAGREGLVMWPPDVRYTTAIEVKASYFRDGQWHATHESKAGKILGALRDRRKRGVNALALLHLGVVEPARDADELDRRMREAADSFPGPFTDEHDLAGFGYCIGMMGGVAREGLTRWASLRGPHWLSEPEPTPTDECSWHASMRDRLAKLPAPTFCRTFIHSCPSCGVWRHTSAASPEALPCPCRPTIQGGNGHSSRRLSSKDH